jgi:hypothetical protein
LNEIGAHPLVEDTSSAECWNSRSSLPVPSKTKAASCARSVMRTQRSSGSSISAASIVTPEGGSQPGGLS